MKHSLELSAHITRRKYTAAKNRGAKYYSLLGHKAQLLRMKKREQEIQTLLEQKQGAPVQTKSHSSFGCDDVAAEICSLQKKICQKNMCVHIHIHAHKEGCEADQQPV